MNCHEVMERDVAERYIAGQLDPSERDAYEEHYFSCEPCLERLELLQATAAQLAVAPRVVPLRRLPVARWMAAAAAVVVVLGAGWWWWRSPVLPQPVAIRQAPPAAKAQPDLPLLARVVPPSYQAPVLRGDSPDAFRQAMRFYSAGDYARAADALSATLARSPRHSAARFYLGICYLALERNGDALSELRKTVALGDSPELEAAHFYAAKALLRLNRQADAAQELRQAIALDGDRKAEEQTLLDQIR